MSVNLQNTKKPLAKIVFVLWFKLRINYHCAECAICNDGMVTRPVTEVFGWPATASEGRSSLAAEIFR